MEEKGGGREEEKKEHQGAVATGQLKKDEPRNIILQMTTQCPGLNQDTEMKNGEKDAGVKTV